jgi:hypothetical protein
MNALSIFSSKWLVKLSELFTSTKYPQVMNVEIGTGTGINSIGSTTVYKKHQLFGLSGDIFGTLDSVNDRLTLPSGDYLISQPFLFSGDCDQSYAGLYNFGASIYIYDKIIVSNAGAQPHKASARMQFKFTLPVETTIEIHTKVANSAGTSEQVMDGTITKLK